MDVQRRLLLFVILLVSLAGSVWLSHTSPAHAAGPYTVTSTLDDADDNVGDGICHTSPVSPSAGACTLRAAIQETAISPSTIQFNITGCGSFCSIGIATDLPDVIGPTIVDGYSQTGAVANTQGPNQASNAVIKIALQPCVACTPTRGLQLAGSGATVKGLSIGGFSIYGLVLAGSGSHIVSGNFIGTLPDGTTATGNSTAGISVTSNSNTIGGTSPADRNLVSGNGFANVALQADGNKVENNLIGTDITGTVALPNTTGVEVAGKNNTIGGTTVSRRNIISGNAGFLPGTGGVVIEGPPASDISGNLVQGNYIGTDVTGSTWLFNYAGVVIAGGHDNTIGGTVAGAGNLISGNFNDGVELVSCGCLAVTGNKVQGNLIGTNAAGTAPLAPLNLFQNQNNGIFIQDATNNVIGGTVAGARHVLSGNVGHGIMIQGDNGSVDGSETSGNLIQGNYIGTDITGTLAVPNNDVGIFMLSASNNTIGGSAAGARNLISGNFSDGIDIYDLAAIANKIQGNYIGTDITGNVALPNLGEGIRLSSIATNTLIGGTLAGEGNLISGNAAGILLDGGATGSQIYGNLIGTNAAGTGNLHNDVAGLSINGSAKDNSIGGVGPGQGNTIAFNGADPNRNGVLVFNLGTTGNAIRGNRIFNNTGIGIHLTLQGNNELPKPVIATAGANTASGTSCNNCLIDVYSGDTATNALKYEGTATASGAGAWSFTGGTAFANPFIVATATDPQNNTSEFADGMALPAPAFTSAASASFNLNQANSFSVTTNLAGGPAATQVTLVLLTGTLPSGVTFTDNGNGTATLAGSPTSIGASPYSLIFRATYQGRTTDQVFSLTLVNSGVAPQFTSATAAAFTVGVAGSFTVTTTGSPVPSITRGGAALPSGVTFTDNLNGTGTLSGTPAAGTAGPYAISFTAANGTAPDAVQASR